MTHISEGFLGCAPLLTKDELMSNVNSNIYGNSPNFGGVVGALNLPTKEHCGADQSIFICMILTRAFTVFNNSMNLPFLHFPKCFSNSITLLIASATLIGEPSRVSLSTRNLFPVWSWVLNKMLKKCSRAFHRLSFCIPLFREVEH